MKYYYAIVLCLFVATFSAYGQNLTITYTDGDGYRWMLSSSLQKITILGGESGKEAEEIQIQKEVFDELRGLALAAIASARETDGAKLEEYKGCAIIVSEPGYHIAFRSSHLPYSVVKIQERMIDLGSTKTELRKRK